MPDFFHSSAEYGLDPRVIGVHSNAPVGIPRIDQVVALTDNKLFLHGPPIEINHSVEYNSLDYRCNNGGETMKYGIAGIYNIDDSPTPSWITQYINNVDEFGTTITLDSPVVKAGETCIVYYYARTAYNGGTKVTPVLGDQWLPETTDILIRKNNDSHPARFGSYADGAGNTFKYALDVMYNTGVNAASGGWQTVMDYDGTGTFRQSDWPVYMSECTLHFTRPGTWPDGILVRITLDGKQILKEFGVSSDHYAIFNKFDTDFYPESGSYNYTPGSIKNGLGDNQLFFDAYEDQNGKVVFRFPIKAELLSDFKIEVYPNGQALADLESYVRGFYIE